MRTKRWLILLFALLLLFPATVVLAHNPVFVPDGNNSWDAALPILDHQVSWAIYGRLAAPGEVDYFVFEGNAGESALIKMDIPVIEGLADFRPSMALVGPGLRSQNATALPVSLAAGNRAIVVPDNGRTNTFYEQYSGTSYWERQELRLTLPETGRYYILLWSPANMVGKYLLVVGSEERRMAGPPGTSGSIRDFFTHPVGKDVPYPAGVPIPTATPIPSATPIPTATPPPSPSPSYNDNDNAPEIKEPSCLFFTETGGDQGGFFVCDDAQAGFRSAFVEWGLEKIGYPISRRYIRDGFVTQAFQKGIMQWRPESNRVALVNIFDELHNAGFDDTLRQAYQTPRQLPPDGYEDNPASQVMLFEEVVQKRQALLDERPALRQTYFASSDPLTFYGLPTSQIQDMGNHYAIRLQRAVLQEWKEDVPWARAGQVTIANGGDIAKQLGALPANALTPE